MNRRRISRLSSVLLGLFLVALLGMAVRSEAQSCGWTAEKTPSRAVDSRLWTGLEPTEGIHSDGTGLTADRDTTDFTTNGGYTHSRPLWRSIDATGGWVFAGYNLGLHVFDARGGLAEAPVKTATFQVESLPILNRDPHDFYLVTDVDVVDGDSTMLAMTGWDGIGMVAFDVSTKGSPKIIYQDGGDAPGAKYGDGVYVTRINNRYHGFLAARGGSGAGLWSYDLTAALEQGGCVEARPGQATCGSVAKRKLSDEGQSHVDGAGNDSLGHYVAFSGGLSGVRGLEVWNVSSPNSPFRVLSGFAGRRVDGVAMWHQGSKLYLAVNLRSPDEARIYDVSCVRTGCTSNPLAGNGIYGFPLPGPGLTSVASAQHAEHNGQHYLYLGRARSYVLDELQAEWLLDVTTPTSPVELNGGDPRNGNFGQRTIVVDGQEVGYWSWYYACNASGSNLFEPADAVVSNGYLYRAGHSIIDVHEVKNVGPTLQMAVTPTTTYQGTPVQAVATAFNCTPVSGGWTWSVSGGTVSGSGSSVDITWNTTGSKSVSVSNTGCAGATVTPVSVQVLQAAPSIGSVSADVSSALLCSPVTFTASNVTGKPPVAYSWEILDGSGVAVSNPALTVSNDGLSATWDTSVDPQPVQGSYRAEFTASNTADSTSKTSALVNLASPGSLGFSGPIGATINFGDVDFTANSTGATEWRWDFGDGLTLQTQDPVEGPAPSHRYDATGTYQVTVEIRNCLSTQWVTSAVKTVQITELNPLEVVQFVAGGPFQVYDEDTDIPFLTEVSGDPELFDYDWNGDGSFEDTDNATPRTTHSYSQPGFYQPVIRIRRGAASKTYQHLTILEVTPANVQPEPDPSLSLSGRSSGDVGQAVAFRATARNCTPSTSGWSWTASGGGAITGTGSSVNISWATTGTKTVRVTNSGCSGASASRTVTISNSSTGGGGDPLVAVISSSPSAPVVGTPVSFSASSSTGGPDDYHWSFGDGNSAQGLTASHTYANAGTYEVILEISKEDNSCLPFGVCTDTVTKSITVAPGGPSRGINGCSGELADDETKLCLLDGRFVMEVDWRDHHSGNRTGVGSGIAYGNQGVTGFFWFFNPDKVELLVKALDATDPVTGQGFYWIFYGSLSDVYYELTVTDTETGEVKTYQNPESSLCGKADTAAFSSTGSTASGSMQVQPLALAAAVDAPVQSMASPLIGGAGDPRVLELLDGRFAARVRWKNHHAGGATGDGIAIPGTRESGYFWFFNERNLELALKIVDATSIGQGYWFFWAGLSDVEYTIEVEDTITGQTWSRTKAAGEFCGGSDPEPFIN